MHTTEDKLVYVYIDSIGGGKDGGKIMLLCRVCLHR